NPAAARTLAAQLRARPGRGRTIAVCGILGDKDVEGILAELRECVDLWVVTALSGPRALDPRELAARIERAGARDVHFAGDVASGCESAKALASAGDRIVVFGSFLTVAPALAWLQARGLSSR